MMSNEIIKKTKIAASSLPQINSKTLSYDVRYRIISEDKTLFSHWSPVVSINPGYTFSPGNINISSNSGVVNVVWDSVNILIGSNVIRRATDYDIWVRWSRNGPDGDWIKKERISTTSFSMPVPSTYTINGVDQAQAPNRVTVEVYLIGSPVTREYTGLRVYNPAIHTV